MGENINLDRIRYVAKKMASKLERQQEENKIKENKQEFQVSVQSMSDEEIKQEYDKNLAIYNQNKYSVVNKEKELFKLKNNPEVKRYITLLSQLDELEREQQLLSDKVSILEQASCEHQLLYLMTYPKNTMTYIPTFRCICCGKGLNGFVEPEQLVINEAFIDEDEDSYHGSITEYMSTKYKYFELLEAGESEDEIIVEIQDELHQNHKGKKKNIKLLRKKEDI